MSEKSLRFISGRDTVTDKVSEHTGALCGAEKLGSSLARELHIGNSLESLSVETQKTGSVIFTHEKR